jgi:hypothetical protein
VGGTYSEREREREREREKERLPGLANEPKRSTQPVGIAGSSLVCLEDNSFKYQLKKYRYS